ncbi:hypothetical protein CAEBREN_24274 [Caenorhabditis brenneri]|uniref:Uncharacterized protein n=1 Tax=Caenorhabditis brenneri TaxID=135651 RepID=G0NGD6_CAEBE|nr:hypothetical protein CAEBREN_24274 [Caenorhabditis brenneri]
MLRLSMIITIVTVALTLFRQQDFRSNVMKYMDEYSGKSSVSGMKADASRSNQFPKYFYFVTSTFFYMFLSRLAIRLLCHTYPEIDVDIEDEVVCQEF